MYKSSLEVRREVAQLRLGLAAERRIERRPVALEALARVIPGGAMREQERPVGALERQQLAQRAVGRVRHPQLGGALAPGQPAGRRRAPGAQVARASPARGREVRRGGVGVAQQLVERAQLDTGGVALLDDRGQPGWALEPEVAEQLGVE